MNMFLCLEVFYIGFKYIVIKHKSGWIDILKEFWMLSSLREVTQKIPWSFVPNTDLFVILINNLD